MTLSPSELTGTDKRSVNNLGIVEPENLDLSSQDTASNSKQSGSTPEASEDAVTDSEKAKSIEESRKLTADLLTSKKYNLPIKEKRFKPLLSFSLGLPTFRKPKNHK